MPESFVARLAIRLVGTIVYLGGTAVWAFFSLLSSALRCDDSCNEIDDHGWGDDPDAPQWEYVGWFGIGGLVMAVAAVASSWFSRRVGLVVLGLHVGLFLWNVAFLYDGSGRETSGDLPLLVTILAVFGGCGAVAVGLRARVDDDQLPRRAPREGVQGTRLQDDLGVPLGRDRDPWL